MRADGQSNSRFENALWFQLNRPIRPDEFAQFVVGKSTIEAFVVFGHSSFQRYLFRFHKRSVQNILVLVSFYLLSITPFHHQL